LSLLTKSRVNRYANLQIETPTLSTVPEGQPLSPDRPSSFGSPGLQFRTKSSGQNGAETWNQQAFPPLPQAAAASGFSPRINPSFSANDIPSLDRAAVTTGSPNGPPPRRSASMVFAPGAGPSSLPPPQPTAAAALPLRVDGTGAVVTQALAPVAALDGFEPRMFPGILNRRRAMSVAQGGSGDSEGQAGGRINHPEGQAGGRINHPAGQAVEVDAAFDAVEEEEDDSDSDED
jgi:hypothetical protein